MWMMASSSSTIAMGAFGMKDECKPTPQQQREEERKEAFKAYIERHEEPFDEYVCRTEGTGQGQAPQPEESGQG